MLKLKRLISKEGFWLFWILVFAFAVRLYKVNNPLADWHSWRQADTASVSRIYFEEGINLLYPRYYDISSIQSGLFNPEGYRFVELPLFNVLHAVLAKFGGPLNFEGWGRLVSILFSLISVYLVFWLGKRFISPLGGLLAAFFFAFLPYNIYYSRVILPEPMATALALSALVLFVKFVDSQKSWCFYPPSRKTASVSSRMDAKSFPLRSDFAPDEARGKALSIVRSGELYLSGFFLALAILIKPHAIFYLVPAFLFFIEKNSLSRSLTAKNITRFLIYLALVLVPFCLWRAWINRFPAGIPFMKWSFNGDLIRFRPAFWRWIFGERLGRLILGSYGLFLFGLGLIFKQKKSNFIIFFLAGMFLYVSVFAAANIRHDYYQIFTVPAIALTLAQGSCFLLSEIKFSRLLVWSFTVVMALGLSFYNIKDFYQINHPEIMEAGAAVDSLVPKDARVIAPYNGDTAFLYQTKRRGWPAVDDSFEKLIQKGARFYVSVTPGDSDSKYIKENFTVIKATDRYFIADLAKPIKK